MDCKCKNVVCRVVFILSLLFVAPIAQAAVVVPNTQDMSVAYNNESFQSCCNAGVALGEYRAAETTTSSPGESQLTPVPLPAAVWLFSTALVAVIRMARRKSANHHQHSS